MDPIDVSLVTEPQHSELVNRVNSINERVKEINGMMFYVVLVLLFMVATMVITVGGLVWQAFQGQTTADESLRLQMQSLSQQIGNQNQIIGPGKSSTLQ